MQRHFDNSDSLCKFVSQISPTVVVSFSLGKDSIAAWLQLKRYFTDIRAFYLYLVPGLQFVEDSLRYYEDYFQCQIARIPHPSLYRLLNNLIFQAPQNCRIIEDAAFPIPDYDSLADEFKTSSRIPIDTFVAHGTRASDSMMRRCSIKTHGSLNPKRRTFMPVFDWNIERLETELTQANVRLPVDYKLFGRSFDGIDERFLRPIKQHFPEDYRRILNFFPLAEIELLRADWRTKHAQ